MIIQKLFCMTIQMWAEALDAKLNVEEVLDVHSKFGPTGSRNECGKTWLMREKREKQTNVDAI